MWEINERYVIRQVSSSNNEWILFDWITGEEYELDDIQMDIIRFAVNIKEYDTFLISLKEKDIDINWALEFIKTLQSKNILLSSSGKEKKQKVIPLKYSIRKSNLYRVHWEISGICNLKCLHCYNADYNNIRTNLNIKTISDWIEIFNGFNVFRIQISGGEPFLRKDIIEILKKIESKYIHIDGIFTNATTLEEKLINELNKLKSKFELVVSLDGLTPQSHDLIRGSGNFSTLMEKFKLLNNFFYKEVSLNVMLTLANMKEITNIFDFAAERISKLSRIRIGIPYYQGAYILNRKYLEIPKTKLLNLYEKLIKKYYNEGSNKNFILEIGDYYHSAIEDEGIYTYKNLENHPCAYVGGYMLTLKSNGDIGWCPSLPIIFMNAVKEPLYKIAENKKFLDFLSIKLKYLECSSCYILPLCGGGCRARVLLKKGNIYKDKDIEACKEKEHFREILLPFLKEKSKIWKNL